MKKKLKAIILVLFTAIFSMNMAYEASAIPKDTPIEQNVSSKKYEFSNDVVFSGAFSSHSMYFDIDKWWDNTKVDAEIDYRINQLIEKDEKAYIKLSINDIPFYSQSIFYAVDSEEEQIKTEIPSKYLKEGSNELKIETYLRITDLPCVDDVNLANWFVISKDSNVTASFNNIISDNNISNFPYPFLKNQDSEDKDMDDLEIIIPDDYSDYELSAAFVLNSYLTKTNSYYNNKISIVKYSDFRKSNKVNSIFIGRYDSFSENFDVSDTYENKCTIKLMNASYSSNPNIKTMAILCNDGDKLIRGIKLLQNEELLFQVNSDNFLVNDEIEVDDKTKGIGGKVTFEEMGINDINLSGAFRRQATISYSIPKNKVFSAGDKIKLFMRYSDNLDFDKALLTIYINNVPIGSKKLEQEKCESDELELNIPSDVSNTNYLDIKIAFDLELKNSYCEKREEEMPWAYVTGDSYLYVGDKDNNQYFFKNYTSPFVKDNMFNDLSLIIPDNLESEEINSLGKVIGYLGKDVSYNNGKMRVVTNSNITDENKKENLIIYGSPKNNKLIEELNNDLWFKYDSSYSKFLSNEKLQLTDPFSSSMSNFQLDISKFDSRKAMLILTSPDNEILMDSLRYLYDSKMISRLSGDCAVIDENGEIKTYQMKEEDKAPAYDRVKSLNGEAKALLGMILMIVVFVLAALGFYLTKNGIRVKKKKKKWKH